MKDYYYILGIPRTASAEDIKSAYRKLSIRLHPDQNKGDKFFEDKFKDIQEAYNVLSDAAIKLTYDERLKNLISYNRNLSQSDIEEELRKCYEEKFREKEEELKQKYQQKQRHKDFEWRFEVKEKLEKFKDKTVELIDNSIGDKVKEKIREEWDLHKPLRYPVAIILGSFIFISAIGFIGWALEICFKR